ncbi:MAG TPA: tetratricopeptide repeat protein [Dongiaceae bacterium]|nr:tetratricopeptide repeat protein [Dongiaceae bacterium]
MSRPSKRTGGAQTAWLASLAAGALLFAAPLGRCQDSGDQGTMIRGDRAEISVTVRDSSGAILTTPAFVKLYENGVPTDQASTSHGRAFFILQKFGDFTIVAEASGYKSAQKDLTMVIAGKAEIDISLQRQLASNESTVAPNKPILAPKAQEAMSKGAQALREGKLAEAEKQLNKAAGLAPGNPDVLYVQGILFMRQQRWDSAETVLRKSAQIDPNQTRVLSALGLALCNGKKYEQAISVLEKSVQLEPTAPWETDWALGKSYYAQGQYEQALKLAEQAHNASRGSSPQAELLLAQCLTAAGRYEDCARVLREFLKSNAAAPEAATAKRWLDNLAADGKIR